MGKHCDLGFILQPDEAGKVGLTPKKLAADAGRTWLSLDLEVLPNTESHILETGTYRLELRVAAANAKPRLATVEVTVTGDWFDNQDEMFVKGIGLVLS